MLAFGVWIFDGDRERIVKRAFGVGERNPVLLEVCCRLRRVVLEPHRAMIYTSYASRKRRRSEELPHQNGPVVVDVGARGPGDEEVAERGEETVAVVSREELFRVEALFASVSEGIGR